MTSILLREHVALRKLIWVGPLTIVSTIIVNLMLRTIAVSIFGVPETFQYLQAPMSLAVPSSFCWLPCLPLCWSITSHGVQSSSIVDWRSLSCASRSSVPLWP